MLYIYSSLQCQFSFLMILNSSDGDGGRKAGSCPSRAESSALNDKSKSLVLVNYFRSAPLKAITCEDNSGGLIDMLQTCYVAAGNRWANYVAVDYYKVELCHIFCFHYYFLLFAAETFLFIHANISYNLGIIVQRSEGGGSFKAVDTLNGKLLCGCNDVHACVVKNSLFTFLKQS